MMPIRYITPIPLVIERAQPAPQPPLATEGSPALWSFVLAMALLPLLQALDVLDDEVDVLVFELALEGRHDRAVAV